VVFAVTGTAIAALIGGILIVGMNSGAPIVGAKTTIENLITTTITNSHVASTCPVGGTVTVSIGEVRPPCGCTLVKSGSGYGYAMDTYLSPSPIRLGANVCIDIELQNVNSSYSSLNGEFFTITNSSGDVFQQAGCVPTGGTTTQKTGPGIGGNSCQAFWDTTTGLNGVSPTPGPYQLHVRSGPLTASSHDVIEYELDFTLTA
jgi:hypothetical protein